MSLRGAWLVVVFAAGCTGGSLGEPPETAAPTTSVVDVDGDGWPAGEDCADDDPSIHPGATERCNGIDDNCDGALDDVLGTWYPDDDGDGFGDLSAPEPGCERPNGFVTDGTDCDDRDPQVYPGARERCNLEDDDCDGVADTVPEETWYTDVDGDGFGDPASAVDSCFPDPSWIRDGSDCGPTDASVFPGAEEACNGLDDDCDGVADDPWDFDLDGFAAPFCGGDDCDDADPDVNPGAADTCEDGRDTNCDGVDPSCSYEGVIDLSTAAKAWGGAAGEDAGHHMKIADLDHDGTNDLVVGAKWALGYRGGAYVAYGPLEGTGDLDTFGVFLAGEPSNYEGGRSIGVGDVTGDGIADLQLGAPDSSGVDASTFFGPITAGMAFGDASFKASCTPSIECGHGSDIADVNADGIADLLIGAGEQDTGGYYSGSLYLIMGPVRAGTVDLPSEYDYELVGENPNSETGRYVESNGDLNGDGVADILISAGYDDLGGPDSGTVYVVHGPIAGGFDLSLADGKLVGTSAYEICGEALALGDVDGDGLDEAIVGSSQAYSGAGAAYVVAGPATGTVSLAAGMAVVRGAAGQLAGSGVDAEDLNGDGVEDLVVGASAAAGVVGRSGAAFLVYGPFGGTVNTADADATFAGLEANDALGAGVMLGDLDGNGTPDIALGSTGDNTSGAGAGAVYVLYTD
jgi:hypothetical protein